MRKLTLGLAAAIAAVSVASRAAAQWYPQPAYGYGYNRAVPAYGVRAGMGRGEEFRVAALRSQIRDLGARRMIGFGQARALDRQAFNLQQRIRVSAWNGINPGERYVIDRQIARLEQRVQIASVRMRYAPRYAYGYGYRPRW